MDDGGAGGVDEGFLGNQASQRFGADLLNQQKGKLRSGDDDLSTKLPLSQRRAKYDGVKAKQSARCVLNQWALQPAPAVMRLVLFKGDLGLRDAFTCTTSLGFRLHIHCRCAFMS